MPSLPIEIGHLGVEILNGARRWASARNRIRGLMDSKSATDMQLKAATKAYNKAADDLEVVVRRMEHIMRMNGKVVSMKRRRKGEPFPWRSFLSAVSEGARALESAVNKSAEEAVTVKAQVIDVEAPEQ